MVYLYTLGAIITKPSCCKEEAKKKEMIDSDAKLNSSFFMPY